MHKLYYVMHCESLGNLPGRDIESAGFSAQLTQSMRKEFVVCHGGSGTAHPSQ
jgi:hypothetical protein